MPHLSVPPAFSLTAYSMFRTFQRWPVPTSYESLYSVCESLCSLLPVRLIMTFFGKIYPTFIRHGWTLTLANRYGRACPPASLHLGSSLLAAWLCIEARCLRWKRYSSYPCCFVSARVCCTLFVHFCICGASWVIDLAHTAQSPNSSLNFQSRE